MQHYARKMLGLAATAGIAALLSGPAPVIAAEGAITTCDVVAKTPSSAERHRAPTCVAGYRKVRNVSPLPSNLDCVGTVCQPKFVLILGIGY
jgi:hypothetical protein